VYDRAWAERCIEFNQSVLDYLRRHKSIETVVLSAALTPYVARGWVGVLKTGDSLKAVPVGMDTAADALRQTAAALRAAGKKVVLVAPPPAADFDIGACLERKLAGRIALGAPDGCNVSTRAYHTQRTEVLALLDAAERAGVPVMRFDPFLCNTNTCRTTLGSTMIYRDAGHLSHDGSRLLATHMNWAKMIELQAR
jgi:SGNH domain (fused to AT3 domains)